ncbi:FAD-dependent monooxygenase [Nocardia sp. NPDC003482]
MSRTVSNPVLIVGAGPAGLALAIELARWGVPFEIVDSAESSCPQSRAFTIHARTAEWLSSIGLVDGFLEQAQPIRSMDYRFAGTDKIARLDFEQLPGTRHRYVMAIAQNQTEELMRGWLAARGVTVRWGTALQQVRQDSDGVTAVLSRPDGTTEEVRTEWLVGCDGLRSTVREQLGMEFEGPSYAGRTRMMNAPVTDLALPDDRMHYLIDEAGMLLLCRLPGETYRVLLSEPGGAAAIDEATARNDFQHVLDRHVAGARIGHPDSLSIFTVWRRDCPGYRRGRIFLAGDAAHIHSIAGGLGLNACIQDAVNLGWKLALTATGKAKASLLDSYEQERLPVDGQVMAVADKLHHILMDHDRSLVERIAMVEKPGFLDTVTAQIAGLGYTYRDAVSAPDVPGLAGLAAGDRAPDARLELTSHASVHNLLARHPGYTLLILHHDRVAPATLALAERMGRRFGDLVHWETLQVFDPASPVPGSAVRPFFSSTVHSVYGAPDTDVACLIRPDGYLAGRVPISHQDALLAHLDTVLA